MMTRREAIVYGLTSTLPDESTARLLEREFARPDLSYMLMSIPARRLIAARWENSDQPIPMGSLLKPFVAYAHGAPFPEIVCNGARDRCWKSAGHGRLTLPLALAYSCNAYFFALARDLQLDASSLLPQAMLNAYCDLLTRAPREILQGMRLSAKLGTAREIRCDAYAKTGTAACRHSKKTPGDGYAVALYPTADPRLALLTSLDGAPGSHAARVSGEILRRIV